MNISVLFTKPITNGASACCRCSWPKAKRAAKRAYQPSLSPAHLSSTCLFATCFAEEVHKLCDIERNVLILMPGAPFGTAVNGFGLFLTDLDPGLISWHDARRCHAAISGRNIVNNTTRSRATLINEIRATNCGSCQATKCNHELSAKYLNCDCAGQFDRFKYLWLNI